MKTRVILPNPKSNWEVCVQRYWEKQKEKWERKKKRK
jgi:hypothetical protein